MRNNQLSNIGDKIRVSNRIMIVSHIRPDGDAIGSLLGLGLALQDAHKDVQMVSPDGVPTNFKHLTGWDLIVSSPEGLFDLIVIVDCSDLARVGNILSDYPVPDINIDHHITNQNFARINLVHQSAVATAEIITDGLLLWNLPISPDSASALLTGIITDTLGFRTSNMTPKAMRTAAQLMNHGAKLTELYEYALVQRSYEAIRFWGEGLRNLNRDGEIVWTTLTMADRELVGYPGRDDADLINVLSTIKDADLSMIFVEQPNGNVKVSWRATPKIDVSQIALKFGGGGHPAAAGAEIQGELVDIRLKVLTETRKFIEESKIRIS